MTEDKLPRCRRHGCDTVISAARVKKHALYCSSVCSHKVAKAAYYTRKHPKAKQYSQADIRKLENSVAMWESRFRKLYTLVQLKCTCGIIE